MIASVEHPSADAPSTPEDIAADAARGAHYAFIPRLVVEDTYHRLTLKKVRVSDGEVIDIYEKSAKDLDRAAMFQLLDETMRIVYSDVARDRSRKARVERDVIADYDPDPDRGTGSSGTVMVVPPAPKITVHYPTEDPEPEPKPSPRITEPKPASSAAGNSVAVSPVKPRKKSAATKPKPTPKKEARPSDEAEAGEGGEVAEYAGRLRAVNTDWDFCIIEVAKRGSLKVDDELLVRGSTSLQPLGKLRVSKVEGSQVVADAIDVPLEDLRAGFKVYRWAKP